MVRQSDYLHHVGIDLGCSAISTKPTSSVAIMDADGKIVREPQHFRRATELVHFLALYPQEKMVIAVDAPRSVPDHSWENYARRSCETQLQKHSGEHVGSFAGVASLYLRWLEIETRHFNDVKVIETYPRAVWAQLKIPHKPKDYRNKSRATEICVAIQNVTATDCSGFTGHQVDAVLSAFTALAYGRREIEWFGKPGEGLLIVPAPGKPAELSIEDESINERFRRFGSSGEP